jgi:F-type H+-transporting ATPase subunit delta
LIAGSVARRYAKALLAIGIDHQTNEQQGREIQAFAALMKHDGLRVSLLNPAYPLAKRLAIVSALIERLRPSKTVASFLRLLTERNRIGLLPDIAEQYAVMVDDLENRVRAKVVAAKPMEKAALEQLQNVLSKLSGKNVIIEERTDETLIAGLVTTMGSVVYDGSLRTQLKQMKESLLQR